MELKEGIFSLKSIRNKLGWSFCMIMSLILIMASYTYSMNVVIWQDSYNIKTIEGPLQVKVQEVISYDALLTGTVYEAILMVENGGNNLSKYKSRYDDFGLILDNLLRLDAPNLINLSTRSLEQKEICYEHLKQLDKINLEIVDLELGAFAALEKNNSSVAKSLILSEQYGEYKTQLLYHYSEWAKLEGDIAEFYRQDVLDKNIQVRQMNFILAIVLVLVSILLPFILIRRLTRPLLELKEITKRFGEGKLEMRAKVTGRDEVADLATEFNKMALEIQELKENLERNVEARTRELSRTHHDLERRTIQANNASLATLNILEDVEESKNKLSEAFKQLKGLDKLKNEFLSFTSHELKTPLTPILIQAQMLEEGDFGKLSVEQKKSVDMIVRNMRELNQLIGDVLDVSIIQTANLKIFPERADLKQVIKQVVEKMESLAKEKNILINIDLTTLHPFNFDVRRIGQVLTNLLSNAIKFTPENGHINIKTEEDSGRVMVKVKDDGVGISEQDKGKLFKAFSQVVASYKLKQKGTGLGLAICKGIIDAHKGKIGVESQLGKGSMFYFVLPKKLHLENK